MALDRTEEKAEDFAAVVVRTINGAKAKAARVAEEWQCTADSKIAETVTGERVPRDALPSKSG